MADGDGVGGWARDLVGYAHLGGLGWGLVGVPQIEWTYKV